MPREKRQISSTGIYHVVIRGLNQQVMFDEKQDYQQYLKFLSLAKAKYKFEIYAYCIMSNHVHLVLNVKESPLDAIFQKLNTNYAVWFNEKYRRTGHLQQGRYHSEVIETEDYFINAIRYVHRNPYKAGLEPEPGYSYPWNSIYEYEFGISKLVDKEIVSSLLPGIEFTKAMNEEVHETFLDIDHPIKRMGDDYARKVILDETGCNNSTEFQKLSQEAKENAVKRLYIRKLSARQIQRLTGMAMRVIDSCILEVKIEKMQKEHVAKVPGAFATALVPGTFATKCARNEQKL